MFLSFSWFLTLLVLVEIKIDIEDMLEVIIASTFSFIEATGLRINDCESKADSCSSKLLSITIEADKIQKYKVQVESNLQLTSSNKIW